MDTKDNKEHFIIGMDGGGTKTEAILVHLNGTVTGTRTGGSTNIQAVGGEKLKKEVLALADELIQDAKIHVQDVLYMVLGLAGAGRASDQQAIKALFSGTPFADKLTVESDAVIALTGAFGLGPGIILIAGTGAICYGMNADRQFARSGGWGYLLGDEGGGYYMGREAIIAALKDLDGRGERTSIRGRLEKMYSLKCIDEIIPMIYQNKIDRMTVAGLAPLVFEEEKEGDSVSAVIIKKASVELVRMAVSVAEKLNLERENIRIALIGSIFKLQESLIGHLKDELGQRELRVKLTEPENTPAAGAAILALEKSGRKIDKEILTNLKKSYKFP